MCASVLEFHHRTQGIEHRVSRIQRSTVLSTRHFHKLNRKTPGYTLSRQLLVLSSRKSSISMTNTNRVLKHITISESSTFQVDTVFQELQIMFSV
ncbi:hypothetical protein ABKN59_011196 [Abortiporus biennis]